MSTNILSAENRKLFLKYAKILPPQNRTQTAQKHLIWVLLKSAWKPEFIGIWVQKYQNWERLGKVKNVIFSVQNFLLPHKTKGLWYILNITSGRARRCLWEKKKICFNKHPRPPLSVHKKIQPNRSSRLAGYRQHIQMSCFII